MLFVFVLSLFCVFIFLLCVFFFKQKTAYEMRISDWSSDVCSSDLFHRVMSIAVAYKRFVKPVLVPAFGICLVGYFAYHAVQGGRGLLARSRLQVEVAEAQAVLADLRQQRTYLEHRADQIGRASCRERVCQYV